MRPPLATLRSIAAATTLAVGLTVALSPGAVGAEEPAEPPAGPALDAALDVDVAALPTAAVAMGDSFISGEGAGDYLPVTEASGTAQAFPGWTAPNSNAFFCHRSPNASIEVADLPGIDSRFNLACSGGQPHDIANPSGARESGRGVASQLDQLRAVAATHDVDVVLVGLGSNNASFTFGDAAAECAARFVGDGYTGWWEVWIHFFNWVSGAEVSERPCTAADLATPEELATAQVETTDAVRAILDTLAEVDADGQHRVVLQDYTNPLPEEYAADYQEEDGRADDRDKFRALVDERYAAGCPAHRASLAPAHEFSTALGGIANGVHATLTAERPGVDLVRLDVQHAFDGARLCEAAGSPTGTLVTPLRLQDDPNGVPVTDFSPFDKLDIKRLTETCEAYYQTCQESWHPNAAGHVVLGQCLTAATTTTTGSVACRRAPDGSLTY